MTVLQTRISELASLISHGTTILSDFYGLQGRPHPSFAADGPLTLDLPNDIDQTRNTILEATSELHSLLLGPFGMIHRSLYDVRMLQSGPVVILETC